MLGKSGLLASSEQSIAPTLRVTANGANARVSWLTRSGVNYSVERSTDNRKFEHIAMVEGNGSTVDFDDVESSGQVNSAPKYYRVLAL